MHEHGFETKHILGKVAHLLHKDDENLSEDLHEVHEKVKRVVDIIPVSAATFLNDDLSIVDDESAEKHQSTPQIRLTWKKLFSKKVRGGYLE